MIAVLFGQPGSGKTAIAKEVSQRLLEKGISSHIVDGDCVRDIFKNTNFSKEGRISNLRRLSEISTYIAFHTDICLISAVFPYEEARKYLDALNKEKNVLWFYLEYNTDRGKNSFKVSDFEIPAFAYHKLNTDTMNLDESASYVIEKII